MTAPSEAALPKFLQCFAQIFGMDVLRPIFFPQGADFFSFQNNMYWKKHFGPQIFEALNFLYLEFGS